MSIGHLTRMRVFTRSDALASGFSRRQFDLALQDGRIVALRRTVFAMAEVVEAVSKDPERAHALRIEALLLALRRNRIAAAATSAGIIHGLEFAEPPPSGLVVCTPDPAVSGTCRNNYSLRAAALPDNHIAMRHGIPVTTVARTLFDLAGDLPFAHAVAATDHARHHHFVSKEALDAMLTWGQGRAGIEAARGVFAFSDPRPESVLESISRVAMHEAGLPEPELQVEIFNARGKFTARADFKWELPVIGDPSGWGRFRRPGTDDVPLAVLKNYFARMHALADLGFEVVTWTWAEANTPPIVANRVLAALERAEAKRAMAARRARTQWSSAEGDRSAPPPPLTA